MTRSIIVSTEVYAAIWSKRIIGEETEGEILSRILGCEHQTIIEKAKGEVQRLGLFDSRNEVFFPENFEIFRKLKGRKYRAIIKNEKWLNIDTQVSYPTLNQLNQSLPVGNENAWRAWKYRIPTGEVRSIDSLRQ